MKNGLILIFGFVFFFSISIVMILNISDFSIEKSSYTDWILTICNITMAGAALGGFIIAMDWKKNIMRSEVIHLATDIKVRNFKSIRKTLSSEFLFKDYLSILGHNNEGITRSILIIMLRYSFSLKSQCEKLTDLSSDLDEKYDILVAYGWDVSGEHLLIKELKVALNNSISSLELVNKHFNSLFFNYDERALFDEKNFLTEPFSNYSYTEVLETHPQSHEQLVSALKGCQINFHVLTKILDDFLNKNVTVFDFIIFKNR
ncbi:hypothetical protein F4826_000505 [Rahnella inusitata]|nr:hypothetical protein [Rahnella inusitata]